MLELVARLPFGPLLFARTVEPRGMRVAVRQHFGGFGKHIRLAAAKRGRGFVATVQWHLSPIDLVWSPPYYHRVR